MYLSFTTLSLWHFIHDTRSIGYGVQWFSPFSKNHYFWSQKTVTSKRLFGKLFSDTVENVDAHADVKGDDNWLAKSFFK